MNPLHRSRQKKLGSLADLFVKVSNTVNKFTPVANSIFGVVKQFQQSGITTGNPQVDQLLNFSTGPTPQQIQQIQQQAQAAQRSPGMSTGVKIALGVAGVAAVGGVIYLVAKD